MLLQVVVSLGIVLRKGNDLGLIEQSLFKPLLDWLDIIVVKHRRLLLVFEVLLEFVDKIISFAFLVNRKLAIIKIVSLLFIFFKNFFLDFVDLILKFALILLVYLFVKDFSVKLSKGFCVSFVESLR